MLQLDRFYTSAYSLFLGFDNQPNILLNYGREISQIALDIGAEIVQLPSDAQSLPNAYRLALVTDDIEIKFSHTQVEGTVKEVQEPGRDSKMTGVKLKKLTQILSDMYFLDTFKQQFVGLFSLTRSPQSLEMSPQALTEALFESLTGRVSSRPPVSLGWQMAFQTDDTNHYINYNVKTYQTRQLLLGPNAIGMPVRFDMETAEMVEHGIELVLDINNRPKLEKSSFSSEIHDLIDISRKEASKFSSRMIGR